MSWPPIRRSWPTATWPRSRTRSGRTLSLVAPPVRFDEAPYETQPAAPTTVSTPTRCCVEVGYDMDEIIQLKIDGAIW